MDQYQGWRPVSIHAITMPIHGLKAKMLFTTRPVFLTVLT